MRGPNDRRLRQAPSQGEVVNQCCGRDLGPLRDHEEPSEEEDKHNPLSDDQLADELKKRGVEIARRTVAKYRGQLGIPTGRLRKAY